MSIEKTSSDWNNQSYFCGLTNKQAAIITAVVSAIFVVIIMTSAVIGNYPGLGIMNQIGWGICLSSSGLGVVTVWASLLWLFIAWHHAEKVDDDGSPKPSKATVKFVQALSRELNNLPK